MVNSELELYQDQAGNIYIVETEGKIKLVQYDDTCYNINIMTIQAFSHIFKTFEHLGDL